MFKGFYKLKEKELYYLIKILDEDIFIGKYKILIIFQTVLESSVQIDRPFVKVTSCNTKTHLKSLNIYLKRLIETNVLPNVVFTYSLIR